MRASVLCVGTEITTGQIVNRNATAISEKLKIRGLLTSVQLVVPDDRKLISEALNFCAEHSDLIFVTGGLGPTSDDFTRDLVALWAGAELLYDTDSWEHLSERLSSRGFHVSDIQKQQCYFPEGAQILRNPLGTANGFRMAAKGKHLFGLPGPPREIEGIWKDHIASWLAQHTAHLDQHLTKSWDCIGVGESQIAELVEPVASQFCRTHNAEIGYRVHVPYVEVKLAFLHSESAEALKICSAIETQLAPYILTKDGLDLINLLASKIQSVEHIAVQDSLSGSFLWSRILKLPHEVFTQKKWDFTTQPVQAPDENFTGLWLSLEALPDFKARVSLLSGAQASRKAVQTELTTTITSPLMAERRQQFFVEKALAFWCEHLA